MTHTNNENAPLQDLSDAEVGDIVHKRFLNFIVPEPMSGCWLWTGALYANGYGAFWDGKKNRLAHRYSYEYANGIIPNGLVTDHLCRVRSCVNPLHLEAVTQKVNTMRGDGISARYATAISCKKRTYLY